MTRSREADVGPPDGRDGKLALTDFELFIKNNPNGKTVSTNLFES